MITAPEREITKWTVERVVVPELPEVGLTSTSRILIGAAMLLENRGWTVGVIEDGQGRFCAVGALRRAGGAKFFNRLEGAYRALGMTQTQLMGWNDNHATKEGVVQFFLEAAARLDAGA